MAPSRAIVFAKWGPDLAFSAFVVLAMLLAGISGIFGEVLTRTQRTWFAALSLLIIALTMIYQSLFMSLCPGRTLEHDVKPPVSAKRAHLAWPVTPSSRLGSRAIGLFMLPPSATLFGFGLLFLLA